MVSGSGCGLEGGVCVVEDVGGGELGFCTEGWSSGLSTWGGWDGGNGRWGGVVILCLRGKVCAQALLNQPHDLCGDCLVFLVVSGYLDQHPEGGDFTGFCVSETWIEGVVVVGVLQVAGWRRWDGFPKLASTFKRRRRGERRGSGWLPVPLGTRRFCGILFSGVSPGRPLPPRLLSFLHGIEGAVMSGKPLFRKLLVGGFCLIHPVCDLVAATSDTQEVATVGLSFIGDFHFGSLSEHGGG